MSGQDLLQCKEGQCACGGGCPRCQQKQALQTKLAVGQPGDVYEQEADRIADQVLAAPANPAVSNAAPRIQRYSGQATGDTGTAPASVDRVLASTGRPLEPALQQDMGQRFGHDFSRVRVHSDAAGEQSAQDVNAHAYTVGHNVVFGAGQFAPETHAGKRLLAHELVHIVQQGAGATASPQGVLQRYSQEDCTDADLRTHIWPADGIAKRKVDAAIAAVTASPVSSGTEALFAKYFMTRTPDVTVIAQVFRNLKTAFDGNRYTYECEEDCESGENAYSGWAWDIHLCMNNLRGRANDCIARTIIHEFTHKYAGTGHGWWFSTAYCYSGCDTAGCPSDLSPSDALGNAYSFAGFAHEV